MSIYVERESQFCAALLYVLDDKMMLLMSVTDSRKRAEKNNEDDSYRSVVASQCVCALGEGEGGSG